MRQDLGVTPDQDLEDIYREHGGRLWWAALAFTGDPDIASDAVAEAFAQALRRGEELRTPLAWIWRVTFRIAAGELKARRTAIQGHSPKDEMLYEDEQAKEVAESLGGLSDRQRAAVLLHYYAGYPVSEIASILGISAPTVRVHLYRGRQRLRSLLGVDEDE
jgi:RNA polymerase sigma-70 factor (ECF subfamily)